MPSNGPSQPMPSSSGETIPVSPVDVNDRSGDEEYLIDLYYRYIHQAHPFILPQKFYNQNRSIFPIYLRKAMCFIASHYAAASVCSDQWREGDNIVVGPEDPDNVFQIQALILTTLASYARFERDIGNTALYAAIDAASRIRLGFNNFALDHEPLLRESWRRTWWELYTIAGLISLISGTNVRLIKSPQMTLPYACETYQASQVAPMGTLEEMQQRFLHESPFEWSSFAYRIEAMRILLSVLDITQDSSQTECDAASASVSSYLLSLPVEKREGLKPNGDVDEVMICALMIIHLSSICLNMPRSALSHLRGFKTVCGNERGKAASETPRSSQAAAVGSANAVTRLISSHTTLKTLSPCFSCAIAFSAVVQLSEYIVQSPAEAALLKENIQLQLMALQSLGKIWPIARVVRGQIADFSREVMHVPAHTPMSYGGLFPTIGPPIQDEQWLQDLLYDDLMTDKADMPILGETHNT